MGGSRAAHVRAHQSSVARAQTPEVALLLVQYVFAPDGAVHSTLFSPENA